MALSIGELVGYVSIDGKGVEQGIGAAEARIRGFAGNAGTAVAGMDGQFRQAGTQAGGALAAGVEQGAAGLTGRLHAEGTQAGRALGDGLTEGAGPGVERTSSEVEKKTSGMGGKVKAAAVGVGTIAGAGLGFAMTQSLDVTQSQAKLSAQLGTTGPMSQVAGQAAGALYAGAYGDSLGEVNDAVKTVMQGISGMSTANSADVQNVTSQVMDLSQAFGTDTQGAVNAVSQMMRTGLATNSQQALDILTKGFQSGNDKAGDLLDTFNEYGTQFRKLGVDGTQAMGLIQQGLQGGARDSDLVADSLKEFSIRAVDGSATTSAAFKGLGLDAGKMAEQIAKGGPAANAGLQTVLDKLRGIKDPAQQAQLATGLFGTQAEDLGKALFALDPSKATAAMGDVAGSGQKLDKTLGDTAQNRLESVKRSVDTFGASLVSTKGPVGDVAAAFGAFGPQALSMAGSVGMAALSFGKMAAPIGSAIASGARWAAETVVQGARATASIAGTAARYVAQFVMMAVRGAIQVGILVGQMVVWAAGIVVQGAVALASLAVTAAGYVAQWVVMAAGAMARAAIMAASWLIAMGPIVIVIALVVGLVALIIANWDKVKEWTKAAFDFVMSVLSGAWEWIKGVVGSAVQWVLDRIAWFARLPGQVGEWFGQVKDWALRKLGELLDWLTGLPGRILGALGDLGRLLLDAGGDLVRGLWDGIVGAGRWLMDKITGWIKDVIPGPILSFLGISSPSKYMHDQVGRWIPAGIADGIIANSHVAADAARDLARQTADAARNAVQTNIAPIVQTVVSDAGKAAQELLAQINSGGAVYEDFSYRGQSNNVRAQGDALANGFYAAGGRADDTAGMRAYLEQVVRQQTSTKTVNVAINNPLPDRASDAVARAGRTLAAVGPWGDE